MEMTRYIKKPPPPDTNFTIVFDDREKEHWKFLSNTWAMKKKRLACGDYSIEGLENIIAIEKKSGIGELLSNLTGSSRPRFKRFLRRLSAYPIKCIIIEDELRSSSIDSILKTLHHKSNGRSKLTPETIFYWVSEIMHIYGIPILFVDAQTAHKILPFIFESAYKKALELK
jgi:hypothetical protein